MGQPQTRKVIAGVTTACVFLMLGIANAPLLCAQSPAPDRPKFEVTSVKPCEPGTGGRRRSVENTSPERLSLVCQNLKSLIQWAYILLADGKFHAITATTPIEGGPAWINSDLYEITAVTSSPESQEMMNGPMLQTLLEDRFQLKVRWVTKRVPVYALTVAKGGPKLSPHKDGTCVPIVFGAPPPQVAPGQQLPTACGTGWNKRVGPNLVFEPRGMSMEQFADWFTLDRPVIDETGIKGLFDFHLQYAPDDISRESWPANAPPGPPSDDLPAASLFTAVQEQLGLKLAPTKGPTKSLVIDHVEQPSPN
jgi:uncharacterized protein (TIGR03435 family)